MKTKITSAYTSKSYVIAITAGASFRYPTRLRAKLANDLLAKVKTAGYINTEKWIEI